MKNTNNSNKKAVIYGRISTDETRQSIDRQANDLERDAKIYGYEIAAIFNDQISGAKEAKERPQFQKMMAFIELNHIKCIFITEISRLGRNNRDILNTLHDLHEVRKINLYIKDNGGFTLDENGNIKPSIEFTINILAAVANQERKQLITRINSGIRNKARKGGILGRPPFGYDANNGKLIINEQQAEAVKFIFNEFERLRSYRGVSSSLILNNYRPKKTTWSASLIIPILKNKAYTGKKTTCGNIAECPQIIDKEQFNRVQSIIENKKTIKTHINTKHINPLKGVFKCGNCGSNLILDAGIFICHRSKIKYFSYVPKNKAKKTITKEDVRYCASLSEKTIYSLIIHLINNIDGDYILKYREQQLTALELERKAIEAKINDIRATISKIEKDYLKDYEAYREDMFTIKEIKQKKLNKDSLIEKRRGEINIYNDQISDINSTILKFRSAESEEVQKITNVTELKNIVISNIIEIRAKKADEQTAKEYAEKVYNHGLQVCYDIDIKGITFGGRYLISNRSNKYVEQMPDIQVKNETIIKGGKWFFADVKEFEKVNIS
jgi:DNA invertase Pin-like site-specific DNA recombinase